MAFSTHVLALIIGLIYPTYFLLTYKETNNRIQIDPSYLLVDYKKTILIFWVLTFLVIGNLFIDKSLLLNFYPTFNIIGIIVGILLLCFIVLQIISSRVTDQEKAASVKQKVQDNYSYLPKSEQEFVWFNLLSISAGICEEIVFRLFVFSYLLETTNLVVSFVLTNIIFALTHIGSGKQNIIGAFVLGLVFTAIYYFTDNIWLSIILHIAIDIGIGVLGYNLYRFEGRTNHDGS